jgi:hypothetical protein
MGDKGKKKGENEKKKKSRRMTEEGDRRAKNWRAQGTKK